MKHANSFRRGVIGLAVAGLTGATFLSSAAGAMVFHDRHEDHGKKISVTRDVKDYKNIRIKGGFELVVEAGKDFSFTAEAHERDIEQLEAYVNGDTLVLDNAHEDDHEYNMDGIKVTITMPTLDGFEVLGAVDADLKNIESDNFSLELKGAGDIDIEGSCGSFDLELKGAGEVDARDFKCKDVEVDVKGVGEASVYASESVDADVGGIGAINVYGKPDKVRQSDGWLGTVRIK